MMEGEKETRLEGKRKKREREEKQIITGKKVKR